MGRPPGYVALNWPDMRLRKRVRMTQRLGAGEKSLDDAAPCVAFVASYDGPGYFAASARGSPSGYMADLAEGLTRLGLPFEVLAARDSDPSADPPFVKRAWLAGRPLTVLRALVSTRARIIHVQHEPMMYGGAVASLLVPALVWAAALFLRKRVVVTLHSVVDPGEISPEFCERTGHRRWLAGLARAGLRATYVLLSAGAAVIVHAEIFKRRLRDGWRVSCRRIEVVEHWVPSLPPLEAREGSRERLGLPREGRLVLFFGYVSFYKGLDKLIDAWERIAASDSHLHLVVAGGTNSKREHDPAYMRHYSALRERALRTGAATWLGFVPGTELGRLFGAVDLMVLPYTELLAISGPMFVAASYGVPVLASTVLRPILPVGVPTTELDPATLAARIRETVRVREPACFAALRDRRTVADASRGHLELYLSLI